MIEIDMTVSTQFREGNKEAFNMVYLKAATQVYRTALRIVGSVEEAEDIVHDVFVQAHAKRKQFKPGTSLMAWLYRITVNTSCNRLRKRRREQHKWRQWEKESSHESPAVQSVNLIKEEANRKIETILASLPKEQRICLVLRELEGLSYEEIARIVRIPINTVRSRLKRARERVVLIARKGDDDEL